MGSRWAGAIALAAGVGIGTLALPLPAGATAPSVSAECGTPNDTVTVTPVVHADETVSIWIDSVLQGAGLATGVPHTFSVPHAPKHGGVVKYQNGSWAPFEVVVAGECAVPDTTAATTPPTSAAVDSTAPPTVPTSSPSSAEPPVSVPSPESTAVTPAPTEPPVEVDEGTVTQCQTVADPVTGDPVCQVLPATGSGSGAILLVASLFAMAGMGLLIVRRRPAGN